MRLEKFLIILTIFTVFMDDFRFGDEENRAFVAFDFYYYYVIWLLFILHYSPTHCLAAMQAAALSFP